MNYRDYLSNILTWAIVTEEVNYERSDDDNVIIIKDLPGNNYRDTIVKNILLEVHTTDVASTKALLDTFAKTYNDTSYMDDFDYVRQFYNTPMVLTNFNITGENYSSIINVSGTLIISSNIADIKQTIIDGELYETYDRTLTYTTVADNQATNMDGYLNDTQIRNGIVKITFMMISRGDSITNKLRRIRRGELPINTTFNLTLIHSDNDDAETYEGVKCDSHTINSKNSALPTLTISFIK